MNKIKSLRDRHNYTQAELAKKSGLSLRTIQRVESGSQPKGNTLNALAEALDVDYSELRLQKINSEVSDQDLLTIRYINLSVLGFFIFPFGNVLFPFLLWRRNNESKTIDKLGRKLINIQILWSIILCLGLSISPLLDRGTFTFLPLIFIVLIMGLIFNVSNISYTSYLIGQNRLESLKSPIQFL